MNNLYMSPGEFLFGLRRLFPPPRHPQIKSELYKLMLDYDAAPRWRKYIVTQELRQDLSILRNNKRNREDEVGP